MTDATPDSAEPKSAADASKKPFEPTMEERSFHELLKSYLGGMFLIANPESFEDSGFGHEITVGWYKARLIGIGNDYLIVMTEFQHGSGKKATKEPVKQFIPIRRIKRISIMKTQRLIHI